MKRTRAAHGAPDRWIDCHVNYEGDECLAWPFSCLPDGRAQMSGARYAARVMCERAHGPAPTKKHQAAHSCGRGNMGCVSPQHVRWATPKQNCDDRKMHGTHPAKARNPMARLSQDQVDAIRGNRGKVLQRELGKIYGISQSAVSLIQSGKAWT